MSERFRVPSRLPLFPIALRMAAHRVTGLLAVVCAVLGGAALITGTGVLAESGLRSQLPPGRLGGADIVVAADQEYHPDGGLPLALPERARVPSSLVDRLSGLPGVTAVVGDLSFPAALVDARGGVVPTADDPTVAGHGWSSTKLLAHPRVTGRAPARTDEIAVPAATGLRTGDRVQVVAGGRPAVRYRVAAVTDAVRGRVADAGLTVRTRADIGETVAAGVGTARSLLILLAGSLSGIVLLITGFVTAGALGVSIAGQRRDLALMRAVGATPRQIRRLAAAQSSVVAAVALAPGVALGYLLADRFHDMLADRGVLPPELPLTVGPLPALATLLLLALTVQISARGAAWRTSRMPATEAVAESRSEPRKPSKGRTLNGVLLIAAACALSVTPLLTRTVIGASATSVAGIVAAIGLALCGPALVRSLGERAVRRLRPGTPAPTWLALANVRAYALRVASMVSPLAMAVVFVLTYTLAQTTVLAATAQEIRTGTLAQYRLSAPALGGLPDGTRDAVRKLPGVRSAAPVGSTTVVWPYEMFGEPDVESVPALIATPDAAGVLDPRVREGGLAGLTGATVAVSSEVADSRDAGLGRRIRLVLGDGTRTEARVVAVYDRGLGFGSLIVSKDLATGHTTSGLPQSLLVRTDGTATAARALADLKASRPGLALENTSGTAFGRKQDTPPEVWINLATIVVLLGYLLLSIANKLVAATAQRRTEIAALRLVGTTPRQIRAMMRREAAVIATAALVSGLFLSALPLALLGQGFLDRPWPAGPAWLLPAVAATIVTTAFLAIELPTRQALRTDPADAIRAT
ncbi:FtsX-like permease family protein [Streptomyces sp. NPDC000348]|uniref:FtsX-like permease family protein n=1 Tax=Streptomyces sp. NPDC000348 TaxID=3364538 RepID=UPI003699779B